MPIYEIKGPQSSPRPETPGREPNPPVDGVPAVIRIRHHQGGHRERQNDKRRRSGAPPEGGAKALRPLIESFNEDLARQNVPIHLVLLAAAEGFLLEVYDCTDRQVCRAVRDLKIGTAELPALLRKLQREAGLLVDTIT